ncbi:MAG: methyltransferase domain-containing protein [Caldilineaceae bacterium]|nr:methyltransferase domain-containing protein [Caldilineaceae bacterium]
MRGKTVLELGAGVGLTGLVARRLGAQVWQTDHQPQLFVLAEANRQQNQVGAITRFVADWRTWTHTERYDLILGADILYERAMHPHLLRIVGQNLAPDGRLLLSDPGRQQGLEFAGLLENAGWRLEMVTQSVSLANGDRQGAAVEVMLLEGARPIDDRLAAKLDTSDKLNTERLHMAESSSRRRVRVALYGTGKWATGTHIPNFQQMEDVDIVALCDANPDTLDSAAELVELDRSHTYTDGHAMLERETDRRALLLCASLCAQRCRDRRGPSRRCRLQRKAPGHQHDHRQRHRRGDSSRGRAQLGGDTRALSTPLAGRAQLSG